MIPFNKPFLHGRELVYIAESVASGKTSGDGVFTKRCHDFFNSRYGFSKTLLTTSCTDALEMCSILLNIQDGDEVIVPSFTFVSSANAFALRGAKIIFADSYIDNPNINPAGLEELITAKTRAIVVVHYAGIACDLDSILSIANKYKIPLVEDAAQSIDSFYKGRPLGSIGALGTFSFHETKNIICGEGGMLAVNDMSFSVRSEIIREKGTNRSSFFRGEVDKYGWVDIGSSFLPSDMTAAYLYAQLEYLDEIQIRRKAIWSRYWDGLAPLLSRFDIHLPMVPDYSSNNAHMFYLVCRDLTQRTKLIELLKAQGIHAVFHYLSLHDSPYYQKKHDGRPLPNSDRFSNCLVRLPMYFELTNDQCDYICESTYSILKAIG